MKILNEIIKLREVCQKHLTEINEKGLIDVFSITVSSKVIWGGLGDKDEDNYYYINQQGWLKKSIVTETGQYQKSNSGIISQEEFEISDKDIECILNGDCDLSVIRKFVNFYDDIYKKYPLDF